MTYSFFFISMSKVLPSTADNRNIIIFFSFLFEAFTLHLIHFYISKIYTIF